jgi:hypothetical protein
MKIIAILLAFIVGFFAQNLFSLGSFILVAVVFLIGYAVAKIS